MRYLCRNPTRDPQFQVFNVLQILDLGGPGSENLPVSLVVYLLRTLPHLLSLGSYERTGQAIAALQKVTHKLHGLLEVFRTKVTKNTFIIIYFSRNTSAAS